MSRVGIHGHIVPRTTARAEEALAWPHPRFRSVSTVDPRNSIAVAEVLRARAAGRWGKVRVAEPPTPIGGGFDSYIHLVHLEGGALPAAWAAPLVVRLLPSPDREPQAHREAEAQGWAASVGYAAPQVLEVIGSDDGFGLPTQVIERAPGTTMLEALTAKPWRMFRLVDQLARLQLQLHALPTDTWPGERKNRALVDQRLALPRKVASELDDDELRRALERAEGLLPVAMSGLAVVCHGDFHPLNVMVDGDAASVIDWTDAGLGPREGDLSRTLLLFRVASIAAKSTAERVVLRAVGPRMARRYRRTYTAEVPLDGERMRAWEALHALHGWSQVRMLHAGGFDGKSSADQSRVPPGVGNFLKAHFEAALAD